MRDVLRILIVLLLIPACSATTVVEKKRTLPSPLVAAKLPDRPDEKNIQPSDDWVISGVFVDTSSVKKAIGEGKEIPEGKAGILMSTEKAIRAAKYVVSYNELRSLYVIDLNTWGREREIYQRHLDAADDEITRWKKNAERSWFEQHAGQIGIGAGLVLGAIITLGILEAVQQVKE